MKTRGDSNREADAKKQRRSCDRIGYLAKHDYPTFEGVLEGISDAMVEYLEKGTKDTFDVVREFNEFVLWEPVGPRISAFDPLPDKGPYEKYVMSLCKFEKKHLRDGKRESENDVRKWVSIRKSKLADSGFGLFTERSFKQDDVITVFVGNVINGHRQNVDRYISYTRKDSTFVHLDTRCRDVTSPFFAAHFANDPSWGKTPDEIAAMTRARNAKGWNAKIEKNMRIVATQDIRKNVEIYLKYRPE